MGQGPEETSFLRSLMEITFLTNIYFFQMIDIFIVNNNGNPFNLSLIGIR